MAFITAKDTFIIHNNQQQTGSLKRAGVDCNINILSNAHTGSEQPVVLGVFNPWFWAQVTLHYIGAVSF